MIYVPVVFLDILYYLILHVQYAHLIVLQDVLKILNQVLPFRPFVLFAKTLIT